MIADVILPIPVPVYYSYKIPEKLESKLSIGSRVVIPLGKSKIYTGIIRNIHYSNQSADKLKSILFSPDNMPFVNELMVKLWEWMAFYYHCTVGEVYKAAVPSYFRDFDQVFLQIPDDVSFSSEIDFLQPYLNNNREINLKHAMQLLGTKKMSSVIIKLFSDYYCNAEYRSSLIPKEKFLETELSLNALQKQIEDNNRAPARKKILQYFLKNKELDYSNFEAILSVSKTSLKPLLKNKTLKLSEKYPDVSLQPHSFNHLPELNLAQTKAITEIREAFKEKKVCLLHGVTSSGKTLLYLNLMRDAISSGKQVLYLLPEIALTTQIVDRINQFTGGNAKVYHSKFVGKSRLELWENVSKGLPQLVIGARSSVFLPFANLGLIIVDEEHDQSFKQHEPAPRYNARDLAVMMGNKYDANVILGSATPSSESWLNALKGKYQLVSLKTRYQDLPLAKIKLLDTFHAKKRKVMTSEFHPETIQQMSQVLERDGQIIVLRNRKGYAPLLRCLDCGWTASCPNCSVHLTYHKIDATLRCHHCQYSIPVPQKCPECHSGAVQYFGYGTQKIEEELSLIFPNSGILRFDQDSLKNPKQYRKIIDEFAAQKTQILVGTQMLTKGLDFKNVRLIVVLNADQMLNYPDFRAFERGFQMLEQVSGRTGRHLEDALVLIQTAFPNHQVFKSLIAHDYQKMMNTELYERKMLEYPPFVHLINIHVKSVNQIELIKKTQLLFSDLYREFGKLVSEPAIPVVEKRGRMFERFIQIKIPKNARQNQNKRILHKLINGFSNSAMGRSLRVFLDADPV
jgi:primosomal protein N' (replication factor Y) (superfamily II helicase)